MPSTLLVPAETQTRLAEYLAALQTGTQHPGKRLANALENLDPASLTEPALQDAILNTKLRQIFAESSVAGDGSDWNMTELGILGDISIAVPVTIFDNGRHAAPLPHAEPFAGTLLFTPGALLRNDTGHTPADWPEVVRDDGSLDRERYFRLYERRLLPVFRHIDDEAAAYGQPAIVTIPGLGCGQFAGPFRGSLGGILQTTLERILEKHGSLFPHIMAVYYDTFNESSNTRREIQGISLMVRPLMQGNHEKPQLCHVTTYEEPGDDFFSCRLFSMVAWDHVSWPGNDFYGGSRCTDDGVKAAATGSMRVLTGMEGRYDPKQWAYLPPASYRTWGEVVLRNRLRL